MANFESDFLDQYLKFGLGSMPKADIDALVMALLDRYGINRSGPLSKLSNQQISERLRTPISKVKRLRYEAALKFGGSVEEQAKARILAVLAHSTLEVEEEKVSLMIEDTLAKNWLQGQLKANNRFFDFSFNSEIIKIRTDDLFSILKLLFDANSTADFKTDYERLKKQAEKSAQLKLFKNAAKKFAEGAAKALGAGTVSLVKSMLATH